VEVYVVMIPSIMEDEQCFSILFFKKFKLRKKLTNHLDFVVKMFAHDQYLYISIWKSNQGLIRWEAKACS